MDQKEKITLDDQLCFALFTATNAIAQSYKPKLEEIGLSYPEYLVMLVIWQEGETTVSKIASRLSLSESTVAKLTRKLVKSDFLVQSQDSSTDGANDRVSLTENGRALEIGAARVWNNIVCQTQMEFEDLSRLRMELMSLTQRMKQDVEDMRDNKIDRLLDLTG